MRRVDALGQVHVGASLAGKSVLVEQWLDGVFLRFIADVPEGDAWWLKDPDRLRRALSWDEERSPMERALTAQAKPPKTKKKRKKKKRH